MNTEMTEEERQAIFDDWQIRGEMAASTEPILWRNRERRL
jgi:hypothetical protein